MKIAMIIIVLGLISSCTTIAPAKERGFISDIQVESGVLIIKRCRAYELINEVRPYECVVERIHLGGAK